MADNALEISETVFSVYSPRNNFLRSLRGLAGGVRGLVGGVRGLAGGVRGRRT